MLPHVELSRAYGVLGLQQGATTEAVKNSYKRLALQYHPDKNKAEDATEKFQEIGSAYNTILKNLEGPSNGWTDDGDDGGIYHYDDDYYENNMEFLLFLFEQAYDRAHSHRHFFPFRYEREHETEEKYHVRLARQREEAKRAEERRLKEEAAAKAAKIYDRKEEARKAANRKAAKANKKKAENEERVKKDAERIKNAKLEAQTKRSQVFTNARKGDSEAVKKGIWEDCVDAAGGEIFDAEGLEGFARPANPKETLTHIAARLGDHVLVEWLVNHNAEPEERDSLGRTAFHVSLQYGHLPIILYFLETFKPHIEESLPIIAPPGGTTLLLLALESNNPKVVTTTLEWHLATLEEIQQAWEFVWGEARDKIPDRKLYGDEVRKEKKWDAQAWKQVKDVLMKFGRFTPPPTPTTHATEPNPTHIERSSQPPPKQRQNDKYKNKEHSKKPKPHLRTPQLSTDSIKSPPTPISPLGQMPTPRETPSPTPIRPPQLDDQQQHRINGEARKNGNRRGRGRGRGRGGFHQNNPAGRPQYQGRPYPGTALPL